MDNVNEKLKKILSGAGGRLNTKALENMLSSKEGQKLKDSLSDKDKKAILDKFMSLDEKTVTEKLKNADLSSLSRLNLDEVMKRLK